MIKKEIPQDDIDDVSELISKIKESFYEITQDHDKNIALSALVGAFIRVLFEECDNEKQLRFYQHCVNEVINSEMDLYLED